MRKETLKIAFLQQDIFWEDKSENYCRVERCLASMEADVDVIVLPETFNTGFGNEMSQMAEPADGATLDFARRMAARHDAMFVASWIVSDGDDGQRVVNRMHFVRPDGGYNYYDKAHTFRMSSEFGQVARGSERVTVEWRGWLLRAAVCYDLRFPMWLRNAYDPQREAMDYDVLMLCANWPSARIDAWNTLLRARAIENESYVVGVNRTGTDGMGLQYNGHSQAIDFKGNVLSEGCDGAERLHYVSFSAVALDDFRRRWPFYLDFDNSVS